MPYAADARQHNTILGDLYHWNYSWYTLGNAHKRVADAVKEDKLFIIAFASRALLYGLPTQVIGSVGL